MNRRIAPITGIAVLAVALLAIWWLTLRERLPTISQATPPMEPAKVATSATPSASNPAREEVRQQQQEVRAKTIFQAIEGTNVPIKLFGKVVDQNEQPIAGVSVRYSYSTEQGNMLGVAWAKQIIHKGEAATDAAGMFTVSGMKGHALTIEILAKEGYEYKSRGANVYNFYGDTLSGKFTPESKSPVIFVMVSKATAEPLVSYGGSFGKTMRLPGDGTPVRWSLWNGRTDPTGELQLTLKRDPAVLARVGQPVTWSAKVEVIGGGIVEAMPNNPIYRAPEEGYAQAIDYPKAEQMRGVPARSFYIRTAEGKYGRVELDLYADDEGATARCLIKASMNPSGSRNLEPVRVQSGGQGANIDIKR
jgi:hypothetical protein